MEIDVDVARIAPLWSEFCSIMFDEEVVILEVFIFLPIISPVIQMHTDVNKKLKANFQTKENY